MTTEELNEQSDRGEPAFPLSALDGYTQYGMTLRDYFAAQALNTVAGYYHQDLSTWAPKDFAVHAYTIADAMLAERSK